MKIRSLTHCSPPAMWPGTGPRPGGRGSPELDGWSCSPQHQFLLGRKSFQIQLPPNMAAVSVYVSRVRPLPPPLQETLQDQQVGLAQAPIKLLLLPWFPEPVRFCVHPLCDKYSDITYVNKSSLMIFHSVEVLRNPQQIKFLLDRKSTRLNSSHIL